LTLDEFLSSINDEERILNAATTHGFITALAIAPNIIPPDEWLPYLWGGAEQAPFPDTETLEQYIGIIIELWNQHRESIVNGHWEWPEGYTLDEDDIVSNEVRCFCEGMLQGWPLTTDDWDELMPKESGDGALVGGFLLSISMLFDPDTAMATLAQHGAIELEQFEEIYNAIPNMLVGLAHRATQHN